MNTGAYKIVIFRSKSLKDRKLYVNIKKGLHLENPITNKSVDPYTKLCKRRLFLILQNLLTPGRNFKTQGAYTIVILKPTIRFQTSLYCRPLFPVFFLDTLYIA